MKINQAIDSLRTSQAAAPKGNKAEPSSPKTNPEVSGGAAPAVGGGSLNMSRLSTRLQTLETRLADGDSFDASRVKEIKQAIRDGSFEVNAKAVADKLISSAHDLFLNRH